MAWHQFATNRENKRAVSLAKPEIDNVAVECNPDPFRDLTGQASMFISLARAYKVLLRRQLDN